MNDNSLYVFSAYLICLIYFLGIIFSAILGNRISKKSINDYHEKGWFNDAKTGIMALLGLLLAFTFSMSGSRYMTYKSMIVNETNTIGTAILRADLYEEPDRSEFRKDFSDYLEGRINFFDAGTDLDKISESKIRTDSAAKKLWNRAIQMGKDSQLMMLTRSLNMIPALNAMFDAATSREASLRSKVPVEVFIMIFVVTLMSVFISSFSTNPFGKKEYAILIFFAVITTSVLFITMDFDRPDVGLIKTSIERNTMLDLRKNFIK